jgi:hypothetical protein
MSANNCPNCGSPLEASAKACGKCGSEVPAPRPPQPVPASSGRKLPVVPLAILGVGVLALVLVLVLMRGGTPAAGPTVVFNAATEPAPAAAPPTAATAPPASSSPMSRRAAAGVPAAPAGTNVAGVAPARPRPTPPIVKVYECRKGAIFGVDPEEALVTVNGKTIGKADDWDDAGGGKKYHFEGPGTYYVKFTLEKYATTWVKIVVKPDAEEKYANVDLGLKKSKDKDKEEDEEED